MRFPRQTYIRSRYVLLLPLLITIFIFSFTLNTSASPFNLSHPDHNVSSYAIDEKSQTIVYGILSRLSPDEPALYSVPSSGGPRKSIYTPEKDLVQFYTNTIKISPNSQHIIFNLYKTYEQDSETRMISDLYSLPLDGGDAIKLNTHDTLDDSYVESFEISSDSSSVIYKAFSSTGDRYSQSNLYTVPITGGTVSCLSKNLSVLSSVLDYKISPDSQTVYYSAGEIWNPKWGWYSSSQLFQVPISGGEPNSLLGPLASDNGSFFIFKISQDSQKIVVGTYTQPADESPHLYHFQLVSIPRDGGGATVLMNRKDTILSGAYFNISPDSRSVAYSERYFYGHNEQSDIYSIPITGNPIFKLNEVSNHGSHRVMPVFSDDSKRVVFHLRNNGKLNLYSADPLTGMTQLIMSKNADDWLETNYYYGISPDSKKIAVSLYGSEEDGRGIYSLPIDGGNINRLSSQLCRNFKISNNSEKIVFTCEEKHSQTKQIAIDNLTGGSQFLDKIGNISNRIDSLTFTPDSKNVIYTQSNSAVQTSLHGIKVRGAIGNILPRSINLLLQASAHQ